MKKCFWPIAFCCVSLVILYLTRDWFYAKFLPERNSWIRGQIWLNLYFAAFCPLLLFFVWRMAKFGAEDLSPFRMLDHLLESRYLLPMVLLLQFVLILILHFVVFQGVPHLADESNYLFQAKIYSTLQWTHPAPKQANSFAAHFIIFKNGQMFSAYPYGWPMLLAFGQKAGLPWLVNPVFGVLTALGVFGLVRDLAGAKTAGLALLFFAFSPLSLILCATYLNHASALFCLTYFLFCYLKGRRGGSGLWFLAAGFFLGYSAAIRPFTAFLFVFPWALHGLWLALKNGKKVWFGHLLLILGVLPAMILLGCQNHFLTGHWQKITFSHYLPGMTQMGFGQNISTGEVFGLKEFSTYTFLQIFLMGNQMLGLPLLSYIFLIPALRKKPWDSPEWLMFLSALFLSAGYFFYHYLSCLYGPRYYSEMLVVLLPLSALGFFNLRASSSLSTFAKAGGALIWFWLPSMTLFFALFHPHYSQRYLNEDAKVAELVDAGVRKPALVFFVEEKNESAPAGWNGLWRRNDLNFKGDIVYARTTGEVKDRTLMGLYPGHKVYKLWYNSSEDRFELTEYN